MLKNKMVTPRYAVLFFGVLALDRITKLIALSYCGFRYTLGSLLSCELTFNRGISWGLFHTSGHVGFIVITSIITIVTLILAWVVYDGLREGRSVVGEVLALAGSCSNIFDRIFYHGVVDFISFSSLLTFGLFEVPIFNVADMCIVFGVGLIIVRELILSEK